MRRFGLVLALLALAGPAHAAEYTKQTHRVPVTQPDENGQPVSLSTDVYLPRAAPPRSGYPLVHVFHGGGASKDNEFDSAYAKLFAEHGYAAILYSQRGHGDSDGQTAVAGPKEMRDLFDLTAWAFGKFPLDRSRIALQGYSQGGLHTNLGQVWSSDRTLNPYGFRFVALEPGNTPDIVFNALVENSVVKLSFGVGLIQTFLVGSKGRIAPAVEKWIATTAVDQPSAYGGALCDATSHDTATSTMKADLAARSVGCFPERMTPPVMWVQAFDDELFPPDMAISMWRRMPGRSRNRLWLDMGGHAAPVSDDAPLKEKRLAQLEFLDAHVRGGPSYSGPPVTYWTRDPTVAVPADAFRYPKDAWLKRGAGDWPPEDTSEVVYRLGADGRATTGDATSGSLPLSPLAENASDDPVAAAAFSATPVGTSPLHAAPATSLPGFVAAFATTPFGSTRELSGPPVARVRWTPASADTQLVLQLFDVAPDGRMTILSRGVQGLRGRQPGASLPVTLGGHHTSALIRAGHRLLAWVMAGDATFYKAYPGMAGGSLAVGDAATLTLPLRSASGTRRAGAAARIRLSVRPKRVRIGRRVRFSFRATTSGRPVRGATIRFAGRRMRTNRRGRARATAALRRARLYRAVASRRGMRGARARVRAIRRASRPRFTG